VNDSTRDRIAEAMANPAAIEAALRRAVREAILTHARAGNPVAVCENGEVVWLQPAEVFARYGEAPKSQAG
jgi:hypothetical protein